METEGNSLRSNPDVLAVEMSTKTHNPNNGERRHADVPTGLGIT